MTGDTIYRLIIALALTIIPILLGAVTYVIVKYHDTGSERASDPLTLQCGRCGKTVYISRTGTKNKPFTAEVRCVSCASRRELKKIRG